MAKHKTSESTWLAIYDLIVPRGMIGLAWREETATRYTFYDTIIVLSANKKRITERTYQRGSRGKLGARCSEDAWTLADAKAEYRPYWDILLDLIKQLDKAAQNTPSEEMPQFTFVVEKEQE